MQPADPPGCGRVLVLGAQGVLGTLVAATFRDAGWSVLRAGRRPEPGPDFRLLDLADAGALRMAVASADLVVNTVPDPRLAAERLVLERGGTLINVSAAPGHAAQQLRQDGGATRGTVVMNAGIAPGLTNIVAADLLRQHPEADRLDMVFTASGRSSVGRAGAEFAHRGLTAVRHHRTRVIALPAPLGRRRCLGFAEHERGWLGPRTVGARRIHTYVCLQERARHRGLLALNTARLISRLPRAAFLNGITEPTEEPVAHWIAAGSAGGLLGARTIRCSGDYRAAAASTRVLAAALLRRHEHRQQGVLVPEEVVAIRDIRKDLQAAGIAVVEECIR